MGPPGQAPLHAPFHFDSRRTRIDWRLLHSVDIDQVQAKTDLNALDRVVDLVAHGDLEGEDVRNLSEVSFLKIFRLAQMMVEYLLHVQEALKAEKEFYQHHGGEAEARAEVFRLKCKEQREQMGILKRDLKQAKKSLKTMELLAAMGKENKEQNAPASEPQVIYVDSPDTLAHVSQLQAEIERLVGQRHQMQSTIAALTQQLDEFEDGMIRRSTTGGGTAGRALLQATPGRASGASPASSPVQVQQATDTSMYAAAEDATRRAEAAELRVRNLQARLDELQAKVHAGADREAALQQELADSKAAASVPASHAGSALGELHKERVERQLRNVQENLESTRQELKRIQLENDGLQEERDALAKKNLVLQEDVGNLIEDLEQTQKDLSAARGSGAGASVAGRGDAEAAAKWEAERSSLQKALAAAEQRAAAARAEAERGELPGSDEQRLKQSIERLEARVQELESEAAALRDENIRLKRVAALGGDRAQGVETRDEQYEHLQQEIENLQDEREQLLQDLDLARERADRLRDELDESDREVKRLKLLLEEAGVAHEAELQQAAQEGRRVRHQTEQFESRAAGGSPGGSQRPPAGPSPASSLPAQRPPQISVDAGDSQDTREGEMEEVSDWDPDSPFQSLSAPAPVRTRVLGESVDASSSGGDIPFAAVPQKDADVLGSSVKDGKLKRQQSDTCLAPAAPAMQPAMMRRHSATATGWDAPATEALASKRAENKRFSSQERQEVTEEIVQDMVEELSMDDMMPQPTNVSGGSFMAELDSVESKDGSEGAIVEQDAIETFAPSESSSPSESSTPGPTPVIQSHAGEPSPLPPIPPRIVGKSPLAAPPPQPRLLSPLEDGDQTHPAEVLAANEQRLLFCQPVEREYEGDEERWEEYKAKFQDTFQYSSLDPTLKGRLATELLTVEDMDDARAEFQQDLLRAMDSEMIRYGVDIKQQRMTDKQFGEVMDEIDRKRVEIDQLCSDAQLEYVQYMRDTIRNHLMQAAQIYGKVPASTPPLSTKATPRSTILEDDEEEDEDLKTLGRFGRPKGESSEVTVASRDSGPSAMAAVSQDNPGTPKTEGGASELEMLSSFDASGSDTASPTGGRQHQSQPEAKRPDRGPVWSRGHDDDFDSSIESSAGGAWGTGRQQNPIGGPRMTGPNPMLSTSFDDDSPDDDDISIEELME